MAGASATRTHCCALALRCQMLVCGFERVETLEDAATTVTQIYYGDIRSDAPISPPFSAV